MYTIPLKEPRHGHKSQVSLYPPDGEVVDPYIVDTDQPGSFERSVMRTIRRWAYEPYEHNGVPVTVNDVKARFTFKLTN